MVIQPKNLIRRSLLMNETLKLFVWFALASAIAIAPVRAEEKMLVNGTDLAGWDGAPGWWRVEDGALTSESTPRSPARNATT